jgi:small-conductance mechanosensitive channel
LTETTIDPVMTVLAVVVPILAWLLSRAGRKATARVLARLEGMTPDMKGLIARIVGYLVIFLGVGIVLSLLGAPIQPLLAAAIVIGVVLALAMKGIAENFAAGILLQTRRPIHVGDEVESVGYQGNVTEMNSRAVVVDPVRVTALLQFWHDPASGSAVRTAVIQALATAGKDRTERATVVSPPPAPPPAPTSWL